MHLEAETAQQAQINETMRAELSADDKFKSYWRPFFGWVMGFSFALFTIAIIGVLVTLMIDPSSGAALVTAVTQLTPVLMTAWGVGLTVLGVNIHKRSLDKQVAAGMHPSGILPTLKNTLKGN